jgi:hypothetical protein
MISSAARKRQEPYESETNQNANQTLVERKNSTVFSFLVCV